MNERNMRLSRRHFLLTLGAGSAAATTAALVAQSPQKSEAPETNDKRATRGYHVTAHIEHYYRTARV
ncbi:MAG: twin-arginine translocation signal domain-containing protein [Burkholderiales bacterium]|nr:twin-arginine translocation signal domain-containing protein [Burkholderiales bacterium]